MKQIFTGLLVVIMTLTFITACNTEPTNDLVEDPIVDPIVDPVEDPSEDPAIEPERTIYNDPDWAKDSWIFEIDPDWYMLYLDPETPETVSASMDSYFSNMVDSNITDIVLDIFEQNSNVPTSSEAISWKFGKATWTEENGIPVDYEQYSFNGGATFIEHYNLYMEHNTDIFAMAVEKISDAGMRPWMSFRMNDRHDHDQETSYLRSEFFYEAREKGYQLGDEYGFHNICMDFSEERVRQVYYDYIREMILKYDVFGVQLDFMRCMVCFDYLHDTDYQHYMTDFIRDIHAVVEEAEVKFGHEIKLMLRLGRSIEHNMVFGFDVKTIVQEKLVDALVPSPRWDYSDTSMPIEEWKALAGDDIAVFIGVEQNRYNTQVMDKLKLNSDVITTRDYVKGYSAGFFDQGADGVYFNNFFQLGSVGPSIWGLTRDEMTQGVRRFTLTGQDLAPIGYESYQPLPVDLKSDGMSITVYMGEIRPTEKVSLLICMNKDKINDAESNGQQSLPTVKLNGVESASVRKTDYTDSFFEVGSKVHTKLKTKRIQLLVYTFEGVTATDKLVIDFAINHDEIGAVDYLELLVEP